MPARPLPPPVRFTLDGLYASALPDETVLQALARKRVPILTRSIRYHRPRGPFCGVGQCAGCLVRVNGVPNVRACRTFPREGDQVRTENGWPSVRWDLFSVFDRVFRHHLDTMHGFRRPVFLRSTYHTVVRRLAGTGRLPDTRPPGSSSPPRSEVRKCAVLVVGGGPAGARAARTLAAGHPDRTVLLLERTSCTSLGEAPPPPNLEVELRTSLSFLPPPRPTQGFVGVAVREEGGAMEIRTEKVLLATGAYDASLLFAGNDRPGVLTGEGALALRSNGGRVPFDRALLVGGGPRAAEMLRTFPGAFRALLPLGELRPEVSELARDQGVELFPGHLLLAARGSRRVRGALLRDRKSGRRVGRKVDAIVLAHRRVPNVPLLYQAGARMHWSAVPGAYFPDLDAGGATTVPGLYAAGTVAGFPEPRGRDASADRAASALASGAPSLASTDPPLSGRPAAEGENELLSYYLDLLHQPWLGKQVVCPCEDVVVEELDDAVHDGFTGTEVIKRYTGAGTGVCQGRYCLPDVVLLLSIFEGRRPPEVGYITQRPPVWPVPLSDLANLPSPEPSASGSAAAEA